MELILKEDVQDLGFKDDIVTVKNGYGRNFLIPQGLATLATPSAKKVLAENLKQRAHKEKKVIDEATKVANALKQLEIRILLGPYISIYRTDFDEIGSVGKLRTRAFQRI